MSENEKRDVATLNQKRILSSKRISSSNEESLKLNNLDKNRPEKLQGWIQEAENSIVRITIFISFLAGVFSFWDYKFGLKYYIIKFIELIWRVIS